MNHFSWLIEGKLAGMARPDPSDAEELRELGVTAVVSLTRRPAFAEQPKGMKVLHLPVLDMGAPTPEQLEEATRFLDGVIEGGGRAVVHCLAGCGRTGTVLAAYLVSKGEEPEEAIHRVRKARPGSIETAEQEHAVHLFAERRGTASRKGPRELSDSLRESDPGRDTRKPSGRKVP